MSRIQDIAAETMTEEQRRLFQQIAGPRGGVVRGPFAIWMRTPAIADRANALGNVLRLEGKLDKKLFELAILLVARHWTAQYEWYVHEAPALDAGVAPEAVEAIRAGRAPEFSDPAQQAVYRIVTELNESRTLSEPTYQLGVNALGEELLIELISAMGFYTMVAIMLNAFDAAVPGNARPLPSIDRN